METSASSSKRKSTQLKGRNHNSFRKIPSTSSTASTSRIVIGTSSDDDDDEEVFKKKTSSKKTINSTLPLATTDKSNTHNKKKGKIVNKKTKRNKASLKSSKPSVVCESSSDKSRLDEALKTPLTLKKEATKPEVNDANQFCPICQVPFGLLKISPVLHTSSCSISEALPDCPDGNDCINDNIFHYRDFLHQTLAKLRDRSDYVPVVFTPKNTNRKCPRTPRSKSAGRKRHHTSTPKSSSRKKLRQDSSPDIFGEESAPAGLSGQESRKKLTFDEVTETEGFTEDNVNPGVPENFNLNTKEPNYSTEPNIPIKTEPIEPLNPDLRENLILSTEEPNPMTESNIPIKTEPIEPMCIIKEEDFDHFLSTNNHNENMSENCNKAERNFNCRTTVCYSKFVDNDKFFGIHKVNCDINTCTPSAEAVLSTEEHSIQASCSLVIKSKGINAKEAAIKSPLSINVMLSNSGWEAVEINGKKNANLTSCQISLCNCCRTTHIDCTVDDPSFNANFSEQDSINAKEKLVPKLSAIYEELVILRRPSGVVPSTEPRNFDQKIDDFRQNTHQISLNTITMEGNNKNCFNSNGHVDSAVENSSGPSNSVQRVTAIPNWVRNDVSDESNSAISESTSCASRACSPLPSTPFRFLNSKLPHLTSGTSRPSSPYSMMATKSSASSWVLQPAQQPSSSKRSIKNVPPYKIIPDTPFAVDAFQYGEIPGVEAYFLSHFHADHYTRLGKKFSQPIYCSQITANLVKAILYVDEKYVNVLQIGVPRNICGVEVDILDANHCPGSVMFLFRTRSGKTFLHVGDFRANISMHEHKMICNVDRLYLDTTYCDPKYDFPSQEEVINKVIETASFHLKTQKSPLFVCGSYTIGKERVFLALASTFNWKIWAPSKKKKIFDCLEDAELNSKFTPYPLAAQIHVLAMRDLDFEKLQEHLQQYVPKYSHIVGFKPTGWTTSQSLKSKKSDFQVSKKGNITIYGVPYSEHSSFSELRRFVQFVRPIFIQVTVNLNKSAQYKKLFESWLSNKSGDGQASMLKYLSKK